MVDNTKTQNSSSQTSTEVNPFKGVQVLIIEDGELMSALLGRYVSAIPRIDAGSGLPDPVRVKFLTNGWDLLEADLSDVKVAVVDLLLPQVTGVDLIKNLTRRYPKMGFVPVSGMATEPMKRQLGSLLPAGFGLLSKPLRKEDFYQAFLKAWNFESMQTQQPLPSPAQETEGDLWSVAKSHPIAPVVQRKLLRKGAA